MKCPKCNRSKLKEIDYKIIENVDIGIDIQGIIPTDFNPFRIVSETSKNLYNKLSNKKKYKCEDCGNEFFE